MLTVPVTEIRYTGSIKEKKWVFENPFSYLYMYVLDLPVVCEIHEGWASRRRDNARGDYHIQLRRRVLHFSI